MPVDRIAKDVVVSLHYKLCLDDGQLIEETDADDPLVYLHGHDQIIPGLERELQGLQVGDTKVVVVEAIDAYGEYDPDDVEEVSREELPLPFEPKVGMILDVEDDQGNEYFAQIVGLTDEIVTLDFNHPMAGQRLHFEVTVAGLRPASAEELAHGHSHSEAHSSDRH